MASSSGVMDSEDHKTLGFLRGMSTDIKATLETVREIEEKLIQMERRVEEAIGAYREHAEVATQAQIPQVYSNTSELSENDNVDDKTENSNISKKPKASKKKADAVITTNTRKSDRLRKSKAESPKTRPSRHTKEVAYKDLSGSEVEGEDGTGGSHVSKKHERQRHVGKLSGHTLADGGKKEKKGMLGKRQGSPIGRSTIKKHHK